MTDQDKAAPDRRSARSQRKAPEIDLKAVEAKVTPLDKAVHATGPEPNAEPQGAVSEPEVVLQEPDIITAPIAPPAKASLTGPMAIAAVIGGLLGTAGGTLLPSISGSGTSTATAEIQKLKQTVTTLEARAGSGMNSAETQDLQQRIVGLEAELAKRVADTEKRLADRLASVETGIKAVETRPVTAPAPAAQAVDLAPLVQRLGTLEQGLRTVDSKADATVKAAEPRLAALSERVEQATRRMEAGTAAPLFTAVQGLAQAFHRGGSFVSELTAAELLGAKPEHLVALKPFAEKGSPTLQQLATGFGAFAGTLAQSGEAAPSGAMSYLQRFVRVRPVGEIGGNTPPDIVRTIEAALARGNIADALAAWSKLPEAARAPSASWAKLAGDREQAAKALITMQEGALAALRTAKP